MFPSRLKKLRLEHKMTQEQLGKRINVTKVSISGYENGNRTPDLETLQKIADCFDVTTDYLLGRVDHPNKTENINEESLEVTDDDLTYALKALKEGRGRINGEKIPDEKQEVILDILEGVLKRRKEQREKDPI